MNSPSQWVIVPGMFLALSFTVSTTATADVRAQIELFPPAEQQAWVGEGLSFDVELQANGQFAGATVFDLPETQGVIVMQTSTRPVIGSLQRDGETWTTQRHSFSVYSQRSGTFSLPPLTARFGARERYDAPRESFAVSTGQLPLRFAAPPDVSGLVSAVPGLQVTELWTPESPQTLRAGDAVQRSVTQTASEFPAMLLPTPSFTAPEGLSIYPDAPALADTIDRGSTTASRTDAVTYVFELPGEFMLPELSLRWWDPAAEQWEQKVFSSRTFTVTPALASQPREATQLNNHSSGEATRMFEKVWLWLMVFGGIVLASGITYWRSLQIKSDSTESTSEKDQFKQLCQSIRQDQPSVIYQRLNQWLHRAGIENLEHCGEPGAAAAESVERMQQVWVGARDSGTDEPRDSSWDRGSMEATLVALRDWQLTSDNTRRGHRARSDLLAELNPR